MKFAASNIAWAPDDRTKAYELLESHGFTGVEVAPGLIFPQEEDPFEPSAADIDNIRSELSANDLSLVSMQSLLFGVSDASLFGDDVLVSSFLHAMKRAIRLGGMLGIRNLVFGSPKQRVVPEHMRRSEADQHALRVFGELGDLAQENGTHIALEFNPAAYGTNLWTHCVETAEFIRELDHPAVTLNFDVGAMFMNEEFDRVSEFVNSFHDIISHVHISEPFLAPAPASASNAAKVLRALRNVGYRHWISIEMKAPDGGLPEFERCLKKLCKAAELEGCL